MTFSPETSWLRKRAPHELTKEEGEPLVLKVQKMLIGLQKYGLCLRAKLDPQRNLNQDDEMYCIEIVPFYHFETGWLFGSDWKLFRKGLEGLFQGMKKLGFVPSVSTRKNGIRKDWPGGGCHIHLGMDLFLSSPSWYKEMEAFHRALIVDFANRPYIRWLFKQWFADYSGNVLVGEENLGDIPTVEEVFKDSFGGSAIEPRFMATNKNTYPTFEFRMFSMVENPDELKAIVLFASQWAHRAAYQAKDEPLKITINRQKWRDMKDLRKAPRICANFLDELGLKWDDYRVFYERNYVHRVKYGKMV